jgi:hypothetical protein
MSGPFIQIGDFVKLTNTRGISTYYNIIDIDANVSLSIAIASFMNYNDQKIIKKHLDGRQSIDDEVYTLQYLGKGQVSSRDVFMTGVNEIDINILLQLDDESLTHVCQVDEYVRSLCNSDDLWRQRLEMNYPDVLEYINPNISLKENYVNFSKYSLDLNGLLKAAEDGNLEFIQFQIDNDQSLVTFNPYFRSLPFFNAAASGGHIDIMNWLLEIGLIEQDPSNGFHNPKEPFADDEPVGYTTYRELRDMAIKGDHPHLLDWLEQKGYPIINPQFAGVFWFDDFVTKIARCGGSKVLKHIKDLMIRELIKVRNPSPTVSTLMDHVVINNRDIEMLSIFYSLDSSAKFRKGLLSKAVTKCNVEYVLFILEHSDQKPSRNSISVARKGGCLEVLQLLKRYGRID